MMKEINYKVGIGYFVLAIVILSVGIGIIVSLADLFRNFCKKMREGRDKVADLKTSQKYLNADQGDRQVNERPVRKIFIRISPIGSAANSDSVSVNLEPTVQVNEVIDLA